MDRYEKKDTLSLETLYECYEDFHGIKGEIDYSRYGDSKSIWINSGAVNIYSSNSDTQPYLVSQMTLNAEDTAVSGFQKIALVPKWIYITQNSGTSTEIQISGINITSIGALK